MCGPALPLILLATLFLLFPFNGSLFGQDIDVKFTFSVDHTTKFPEQFQRLDIVSSELDLGFEVLEDLEAVLEIEADRLEVEVDEIYLDWQAHDYANITVGMFENALVIEEYIPAHKRMFGAKSLVAEYIDTLGYVREDLGVSLYKDYKKKIPFSYFGHLSYISSTPEVQLDMGFLYGFNKKDSYIGLLGGYLPYLVRSSDIGRSATTYHNFVIDFVWSDYENDFVHGLELTVGSNLLDPVGLIHATSADDRSYFLGGDLHLGYTFSHKKFDWIPALRFTVLLPDITVPEARQIEIRLGNLLRYDNNLFFHLDGGVNLSSQSSGDKRTRIEPIYALVLIART
jgi:hypothetical protein